MSSVATQWVVYAQKVENFTASGLRFCDPDSKEVDHEAKESNELVLLDATNTHYVADKLTQDQQNSILRQLYPQLNLSVPEKTAYPRSEGSFTIYVYSYTKKPHVCSKTCFGEYGNCSRYRQIDNVPSSYGWINGYPYVLTDKFSQENFFSLVDLRLLANLPADKIYTSLRDLPITEEECTFLTTHHSQDHSLIFGQKPDDFPQQWGQDRLVYRIRLYLYFLQNSFTVVTGRDDPLHLAVTETFTFVDESLTLRINGFYNDPEPNNLYKGIKISFTEDERFAATFTSLLQVIKLTERGVIFLPRWLIYSEEYTPLPEEIKWDEVLPHLREYKAGLMTPEQLFSLHPEMETSRLFSGGITFSVLRQDPKCETSRIRKMVSLFLDMHTQ